MYTTLTLVAAFALGAPALKDKEPLGKGPGYLGIRFSKAESDGLLITEIQPDSPALRAGLKADDIMVKVDNIDLKDADTAEFLKIVSGYRPGTVVALDIKRGSGLLTIKVKLGVRPADFQTNIPPPQIELPIPPPQ